MGGLGLGKCELVGLLCCGDAAGISTSVDLQTYLRISESVDVQINLSHFFVG